MNWKIVSLESIKGGTMRYLKPLRPFFAWSQLSIPTVYDDSLSYYEVLNKCIFHFNEMLKIMQENYEIIDEAFAKILEECEAAIARCEEAAARAEAAQSAAEKAQAAAEAAQVAAEAAQKLAEAAQAAAEAARDDAVTAQKAAEAAQAAAEAAQAAAEAAQAAAEAAQKKAETAQTAAEAAQAKAEDAQEKAESARDAAQAAQTAAEAAQQKAEEAQTAAESARDAAEAAQTAAESARDAAQEAQVATENARDEAQAAQVAAEAAQKKAEAAQEAAEASEQAAANSATNAAASASNAAASASNAAESASSAASDATNASNSANQAAESATDAADSASAAHTSETNAADSAADAAASAEEIKNALDNYYDKTESDNTFVKKAGDTMTGNLVMSNSHVEGASSAAFFNLLPAELTDLNNLNINGYFILSENLTNAPNFKYCLLYNNIVKGSKHITQVAFQRITGNNIAVRNFNDRTSLWSDWTYFTTQSDITDNYLPLSGGTMTGKINVQDEWNDTFTGLSKGNYVTTIIENSDLNDVKTNCLNFYTTTVASSEESKNFPAKVSGFLVSLVQSPSIFIRQIYYTTPSNTIYTRVYRPVQNSWSTWEEIATTSEDTVKIHSIKETEHLRFIAYDLGNYYKVEGYTKIQLAWRIPKTIESNPVVGTVYKYSTFTDFDEIKGTDPYTMSSDNHINVCPGLDYFRPNGFTSGTSAGNMLSNIVFNDTAGNFYFEIQITWPDNEVWDYIGDHYNVLINENSLIGTLIVSK